MSITPATPSELDFELKSRRKGRWALALVIVILLAIFVPPFISLNRLKGRVGATLSDSLGRRTNIGRISLRLLPQPGFDLKDVNIQDDPSFSAEPMLHADQVTATLRLSSLWRRRLEIASLTFQEPSVNLVRNDAGKWNIAALLERAQKIPSAPTAKSTSELRPRFPYVEASDARINFKIGMEKKAYAFSEADLALWLASEDEWHVRLEARPIRSDRNLHDTGTIRVEGTFQRASDPHQTPLNLTLALDKGQLGQLSEFIYGRDRGWRGGLDATGTVSGSPADLQLTLDATLDDFRRYDITGSDSSHIHTRCTGRYVDSAEQPQSLTGVDCRLPAGNGDVRLKGDAKEIFVAPQYDLSVAVSQLPASVLASAARRMKKGVIADLNATGEVNAAFTVKTGSAGAPAHVIVGGGTVRDLRVTSKLIKPELEIGEIKFAYDRDDTQSQPRRGRKPLAKSLPAVAPSTLRITSTPIPLGAAGHLAYLEGAIHSGDFSLSLRGQADLARALPIAQAFGFPTPRTSVTGLADVNFQLLGIGHDFPEPWLEGKASLSNVQIGTGPFSVPVNMDYATAELSRAGVNFWTQEADLGKSGIRLRGNVTYPLGCKAEACPVHFALSSNEIRLDDVNALLNPQLHDRPWYSFGKRDTTGLKDWIGEGTINVGRLLIKSVALDRFSAFVHFGDGKLDVTNGVADLFAGKHLGELHASFSGSEPQYDLAGTVTNASLDQLGSSLWSAAWHGSPAHGGVIDAKYQLHLSGSDAATLFKTANGTADLLWKNGAFTGHADNGAARTLAVTEFVDRVTWKNGALQVPPAVLKTASGPFEISGTFARSYDLRVQSNGKPVLVAFGTLTAVPPSTPVTAKK